MPSHRTVPDLRASASLRVRRSSNWDCQPFLAYPDYSGTLTQRRKENLETTTKIGAIFRFSLRLCVKKERFAVFSVLLEIAPQSLDGRQRGQRGGLRAQDARA